MQRKEKNPGQHGIDQSYGRIKIRSKPGEQHRKGRWHLDNTLVGNDKALHAAGFEVFCAEILPVDFRRVLLSAIPVYVWNGLRGGGEW